MKLARFSAGGAAELGIIEKNGIFPVSRVAPALGADPIRLIAGWDKLSAGLKVLAENSTERLALESVRLLAPIPRPGKILAIGLNYRDHIAEMGHALPENPTWFCKQPTSANGPYDSIPLPKVSSKVDYEAELVAVVGTGGRYIRKEDAPAAVFGFCCGNDVSARDWQNATPQWMLGKGFDGHAPFGPWIVTADEVGDPHNLNIASYVNGEKRQSSNTRHLLFNVWDQLSYVSQVMTLEPGDLIFTGTPGGVGMGRKPPVFLKDGDIVRIEIDTLGHIEGRCAAENLPA
ncbi:MAG: fumarylacetoacetate hydrolase family protein [Rhizomicrobium sp.]